MRSILLLSLAAGFVSGLVVGVLTLSFAQALISAAVAYVITSLTCLLIGE